MVRIRARSGPWVLSVFLLFGEFLGLAVHASGQDPKTDTAKSDQQGSGAESAPPAGSQSEPQPSPPADYDNSLGLPLLKHLAEDQESIWTSPAHLHAADAEWLLPAGLVTAGLLATDTDLSRHLHVSKSRMNQSSTFSNYGLGAMAGAGAALYLWGRIVHDEHKRETGLLAGEAALDSLAVTEVLEYSTGRQTPLQNNYQGNFGAGGTSFPSVHSTAAWSIAGIFAHEYPGTLPTLLSYGMASAIGSARITAKDHFPSDVFLGGIIGYLTARQVYRAHHDPEIGGADWSTYVENRNAEPPSQSFGSPFVPLDSWIYPAFERLAALGYINAEFLDVRPWTRIECANLTQDAADNLADGGAASGEASTIISSLETEFADELDTISGGENKRIRLESAYTRMMDIDGKPLADSYHFGQTIINDFGRPYQQGFDNVSGFSGYATAGRYSIYVRGEYEHAPSVAAYPLSVRQLIATLDSPANCTPVTVPNTWTASDCNSVQPGTPIAQTDRFTLLDTYVGVNLDNWEFTFGKQSLWWAPDEGSALLFSDNAEPTYMFRTSRVSPFHLPWILRYVGPMKIDAFFGKLAGDEFPPRPLIHGEKITFKPTDNLQFGFSRLAEFGGVGRPLTLGAVWHSYISAVSSVNYSNEVNPGKRTGGFDMSYRIPGIRNWLTFYTDSLSSDDPNPIDAPRRAAINPGIYMPRIPGLNKLDLRLEAVNTETPARDKFSGALVPAGQYIYWEQFYHDLGTNNRNLIGSWIGRAGQGYQAWTTYHFNARNDLQFGYRRAKVDAKFIPGGETLEDGSVKFDWWIHNEFSVSANVQYEKWVAPVLASGPQTNWTSYVEVGFWPHSWTW